MGSIDSQAEGSISGSLHAPEDFCTPVQTTAHVELKDLRMVGARGDLFQARLGNRTDEVHRTKLGRGLRHSDSALRGNRLQGTDGRHHNGNAQLLAQKNRRSVDL
jgi:hypothetical protein